MQPSEGPAEVHSIPQRLTALHPARTPGSMPFLVWLLDPADEEVVRKIEQSPLMFRMTTIALQRFRCFRLVVPDLPEGVLKKDYAAGLGFMLFDPAGEPIGAPLTGRRSTSTSSLARRVEEAWVASYTTGLRDYLKPMSELLDRSDKIEVKQKVLERMRTRLEMKPNATRAETVERDAAGLAKEREQIEKEIAALVAECRLRPEFLPVVKKPVKSSAGR